jgi:hypothetical protein
MKNFADVAIRATRLEDLEPGYFRTPNGGIGVYVDQETYNNLP